MLAGRSRASGLADRARVCGKMSVTSSPRGRLCDRPPDAVLERIAYANEETGYTIAQRD